MKGYVERRELAERLSGRGYGRCERCRLPWSHAKGHSITYQQGSGVFVLCEDCWNETGPAEREIHARTALAYYWRSADFFTVLAAVTAYGHPDADVHGAQLDAHWYMTAETSQRRSRWRRWFGGGE